MNILAKIADAREAAAAASKDFEQKEMGSADFFSSFSTWNKLNSELDTLEKVQNLITTDAFAGMGAEAISLGLERVFSTGMQFTPSMIDAQTIQNAANGAMLGQGALNTLNNGLDYAQSDITSTSTDSYIPYGGSGGGFPNFNESDIPVNYDHSSSYPGDLLHDGGNPPYQIDSNSNIQMNAGKVNADGPSYSSVMSGDYLEKGNPADIGNKYANNSQKLACAGDQPFDSTLQNNSELSNKNEFTQKPQSYSGIYSDSIHTPLSSSTELASHGKSRGIRLTPENAKINQNVVLWHENSEYEGIIRNVVNGIHLEPNRKFITIEFKHFYRSNDLVVYGFGGYPNCHEKFEDKEIYLKK